MYYKPQDPLDFMEYCIQQLQQLKADADNGSAINKTMGKAKRKVNWNSIVERKQDYLFGVLKSSRNVVDCPKCKYQMIKFLPVNLSQHLPKNKKTSENEPNEVFRPSLISEIKIRSDGLICR
jgi:hypothetical protein